MGDPKSQREDTRAKGRRVNLSDGVQHFDNCPTIVGLNRGKVNRVAA